MKIIKLFFDTESFVNHISSNIPDMINGNLYILTWQDGDGFLDKAKEDSGIKNEQKQKFYQKDKHYLIKTKQNLIHYIYDFLRLKCFESINGVYKLGFEIYFICKEKYYVFCPLLGKGYYGKLNLFNRIIGFLAYKEPWENEKFGYWEPQNPSSHQYQYVGLSHKQG